MCINNCGFQFYELGYNTNYTPCRLPCLLTIFTAVNCVKTATCCLFHNGYKKLSIFTSKSTTEVNYALVTKSYLTIKCLYIWKGSNKVLSKKSNDFVWSALVRNALGIFLIYNLHFLLLPLITVLYST